MVQESKVFCCSGEKAELRPFLAVFTSMYRTEVGVAPQDSFKFFHDRMQVDELKQCCRRSLITSEGLLMPFLRLINGNETVDVSFGRKHRSRSQTPMVMSRLIEGAYPKFKVVFEQTVPYRG